MTAAESKDLKKGARVYWQGDIADGGTITDKSWDAVTITWDNGLRMLSTMETCAKSCGRHELSETLIGTARPAARDVHAGAVYYRETLLEYPSVMGQARTRRRL